MVVKNQVNCSFLYFTFCFPFFEFCADELLQELERERCAKIEAERKLKGKLGSWQTQAFLCVMLVSLLQPKPFLNRKFLLIRCLTDCCVFLIFSLRQKLEVRSRTLFITSLKIQVKRALITSIRKKNRKSWTSWKSLRKNRWLQHRSAMCLYLFTDWKWCLEQKPYIASDSYMAIIWSVTNAESGRRDIKE